VIQWFAFIVHCRPSRLRSSFTGTLVVYCDGHLRRRSSILFALFGVGNYRKLPIPTAYRKVSNN